MNGREDKVRNGGGRQGQEFLGGQSQKWRTRSRMVEEDKVRNRSGMAERTISGMAGRTRSGMVRRTKSGMSLPTTITDYYT